MPIIMHSVERQLRELFAKLPATVTLLLFTNGQDETAREPGEDTRQVVDELVARRI